MDVLDRSFPGQTGDIRRLRSSNLVFAEICRDYELLLSLLPRDADDPALPDIRDSLAGLEEEMRRYLERPESATPDLKTKMKR